METSVYPRSEYNRILEYISDDCQSSYTELFQALERIGFLCIQVANNSFSKRPSHMGLNELNILLAIVQLYKTCTCVHANIFSTLCPNSQLLPGLLVLVGLFF